MNNQGGFTPLVIITIIVGVLIFGRDAYEIELGDQAKSRIGIATNIFVVVEKDRKIFEIARSNSVLSAEIFETFQFK